MTAPMLLLCYNLLTQLALIILLPVLPLVIGRKKYRDRILARLGGGLSRRLASCPRRTGQQTIWVHALSVGEVTSALPLVKGIRSRFPESRIIFSASSRSGEFVARRLIAPLVEAVVASPLDWLPTIEHFLTRLQPDLFILVETDFWPNWLNRLAARKIPLLLVNGRISASSFTTYHRYAFFFRPMFASFSRLSMQTGADAGRLRQMGIAADTILTLGNLKFDTLPAGTCPIGDEEKGAAKERYGFAARGPLWICGSTHRGEEQIILPLFAHLRERWPDLQLLIAPRQIERAGEIAALADALGLPCRRRTDPGTDIGPVLLLDTLGELTGCYPLAELVFIGGSLVAEGGHNPLEPAACGIPVLFGPHMEDFLEIAATLTECGGALQLETAAGLGAALEHLLADSTHRLTMAAAARDCVVAHRGVVERHLEVIATLLGRGDCPAG